ncbi:MAG: DUF4384 domain-containing protein [Proteobacteria bacterium]|nr:DUF4384 domain-containing protein [Pseudomonadota bacterium]MBU1739605.1 DUF4384 domain-containing protein [Pseudomonadota bacterium]
MSFAEGLTGILSRLPAGKRVACGDFTSNEGKKTKLTAEITQLIEPMAVEIGKEHDLQFVERRDLKLIMEEWQLNMAGLTEGDVGARSLIDADFLLIGKVLLEKSKVRCDLKLSNLQNGEIIATARVWREADPVYYQWVAQAEAESASLLSKSNQATSADTFLRLWTDAPKYEIGDRMKIFFEVAKPLYVKIIDVTPAGDVMTIFPNPYQPDNFCQPGRRYQIPPPDADFSLEVTPPAGVDRIKAIASEKPLPVSEEIRTRGIRFTKEVMTSSPTRASISFAIN